MKNTQFYQALIEKMHEVATIPPQRVGPLTPLYKRIIPSVKFYPWRIAILASIAATIFLYLLFGVKLVKLASLLQFGF